MGSKGSNPSSTTNVSNSPPPDVMAAYDALIGRATGVANAPYTPYTGNTVAPLTPQQTSGINEESSLYGSYQPYLNAANSSFGAATTPLWPSVAPVNSSTINQYLNPATSDVLATTQQQFANLNAQQNQGVIGSAIQQGAFGGDRAAVAQGILGGQQTASEAPVLAGVEQGNYNTALQTAEQQQGAQLGANEANSWLNSQAGFGYGQLGAESTNLGLTTAGAGINAGSILQQQNQSELNVPYEQFLAQQAYPFQTTGWLGSLIEGIGSNSGGTGTSTTSQNPGGDQTMQDIGTAIEVAGLIAAIRRGGRVPMRERGGVVPRFMHGDFYEHINPGRHSLPVHAHGGGIIPHRDMGGIISISPGDLAGKLPPGVPYYVPPPVPLGSGKGPPTPSAGAGIGSSAGSAGQAGGANLGALKGLLGTKDSSGNNAIADAGSYAVNGLPYDLGLSSSFYGADVGALSGTATSDLAGAAGETGLIDAFALRRGGIVRRDAGGVMPYDEPGYEIEDMPAPAAAPVGNGPPQPQNPAALSPSPTAAPGTVDALAQNYKPYEKPGYLGPEGSLTAGLMAAGELMATSHDRRGVVSLGRGLGEGYKAFEGANTAQQNAAEKSDTEELNIDKAAQELSETAKFHAGELKKADAANDLAQQREKDTANYQTGELKKADAANDLAQQREKDTANYQTGELGARQRGLNIQQQNADAGRFQYVNGTQTDPASGQPQTGMWKIEGKTGNREFIPDASVTGKTSGAQSASQWKFNAWLAAHPGDSQGALDFVAGHKQMSDQDIYKAAMTMAESEGKASSLAGDELTQAVNKRAPEIFQQIKGAGAAPAAKPTPANPASANPAAAATSLPPAALSQLKAGTVTTFNNGQKWTLGSDGQPQQVP